MSMTKNDLPAAAAAAALFVDTFNNSSIHEQWTETTSMSCLQEVFQEQFSFIAKENNIPVGALIGHQSTIDLGPVSILKHLW